MPYALVVLVAVLVLALALVGTVTNRALAAAPPKDGKAAPAPAPDTGPRQSKEQLKQRLEQLAKSPPPKDLKPGAMCYDMAGPPDTADYACPVCASKTAYPLATGLTELVGWQLDSMRQAAKALPGIDARLDELELCRKCMRQAPAAPAVVLVVRYPDGREVRTRAVTPEDLKLLAAFAAGRDRHEAGQGREEPLKDQLPRIRVLLGL